MEVAERVPLASYTTMGLGGPARWFAHAHYDADVRAAWAWAREHHVPLRVLGGGSNVVAPDAEIDALVLHVDTRGIEWRETADAVEVTVAVVLAVAVSVALGVTVGVAVAVGGLVEAMVAVGVKVAVTGTAV